MNESYPVIKIPKSFDDVKKSTIPLPKEPLKPTMEEPDQSFGCLIPFIFLSLILIFGGFIQYSHKQSVGEILTIILGCVGLFFTLGFSRAIFSDNFDKKKKYKLEIEKYDRLMDEYHINLNETKRLRENNSYMAQYRKEQFTKFLKTIPQASIHSLNINIGRNEKKFFLKIKEYFPENVLKDKVIEIFNSSDRAYQPDIIFRHESNLHIDIEIDEPYTAFDYTPIHYIDEDDRKMDSDGRRDFYFECKNWIVVRFAEFQIVRYPDSCCKEIAKILVKVLDNYKMDSKLWFVPDLIRIKRWNKQEAMKMVENDFRYNYPDTDLEWPLGIEDYYSMDELPFRTSAYL